MNGNMGKEKSLLLKDKYMKPSGSIIDITGRRHCRNRTFNVDYISNNTDPII